MAAFPWFPLYVGDYIRDTSRLTTEQHGAYFLLLLDEWANGPLPTDDDQLALIARVPPQRWPNVWRIVSGFFRLDDGHLVNPRLEAERSRVERAQRKKSDAGRGGAVAKWRNQERVRAGYVSRARRLAEGRAKGRHSKAQWAAMLTICGGRCARCGGADAVKDHIEPLYQGGSDAIENLQPLCMSCNSAKGPEVKDYRPPDWRERLAGCLANAWQTPGNHTQKELIQGKKEQASTESLDTDSQLEGNVVPLRGRP